MPRIAVTDRTARTLRFLTGIGKNRRARTALARRGFTKKEYDEGWGLFHAATRIQFNSDDGGKSDPTLIRQLDAWENRWFPIVAATLGRHHPELYAFVFKNLTQTEGAAVIATVGTFHERITALGAPTEETKKLPRRKEGLSLLTQRGLTQSVLDDAAAMLTQTKSWGDIDDTTQQEAAAAELAEAEQAMWAWYKEWSRIVRVEVTDRLVLKQLGFLADSTARGARAGRDDEENEVPSGGAPA